MSVKDLGHVFIKNKKSKNILRINRFDTMSWWASKTTQKLEVKKFLLRAGEV